MFQFCSYCGAKFNKNAKFCSECGKKNPLLNMETERDDIEKNILEQEREKIVVNFNILNHDINLTQSKVDYILIRNQYEKLAGKCVEELEKKYYSSKSLGQVIKESVDIMNEAIVSVIDISIHALYKDGIIMSHESFFEKYYNESMNYELMIDDIVEKYAEITGEQQELENYRSMQKASKSRFVGGGFGVKGALKGAITAGVMNAGLDFVRSFGENRQEREDQEYIRNKMCTLRKSDFCKRKIVDGAYVCIISIFEATMKEYVQHGFFKTVYTSKEQKNAGEILDVTQRYEVDEIKAIDNYFEIINMYPYKIEVYKELFPYVKDSVEIDKMYFFMQYLGIWSLNLKNGDNYIDNVDINVRINDFFEKSELLHGFKFDICTPELYYELVNEKKKLDEKLGENAKNLDSNWHYFMLNEYLRNARDRLGKKLIEYKENSVSTKILTMEEYVLELFKVLEDANELDLPFDFIVIPETMYHGAVFREKDLKEYYNKKLQIGERRYLFVYDSSFMKIGKSGFAISANFFYSFKDNIVIKLSDVRNFLFDEVNVNLSVETEKGIYLVPYEFSKFEKSDWNRHGTNITYVLNKILGHYKQLYSDTIESGIKNGNTRELAVEIWNSQWICVQISALLNCEVAWYFHANKPADEFDALTRISMIYPNMYKFPNEVRLIDDRECLFLENNIPVASMLNEDERFSTAINALWSYKRNSKPAVQLSVIWGGIESLFLIERGIKTKLSIAASRFILGSDDMVNEIKELYEARCKAVHELKNSTKELLESSVTLLHQLILKCIEKQSIPNVEQLLE